MDNIEGYHFVCIFLLPTVTNITLFPQITANILEYCQYCQYRVSNHSIIQPCNTPVGIDYTFRPSSTLFCHRVTFPKPPVPSRSFSSQDPQLWGCCRGARFMVSGLWVKVNMDRYTCLETHLP